MSDEQVRDLERRVRAGDEGARLPLTAAFVRRREGVIVAWDQRVIAPEGTVPLEVKVKDRHDPKNPHSPRRKEKVLGVFALAVLDLADLYAVVFEHQNGRFQVFDLETGRAISGAFGRKACAKSFVPVEAGRVGTRETRRRARRIVTPVRSVQRAAEWAPLEAWSPRRDR